MNSIKDIVKLFETVEPDEVPYELKQVRKVQTILTEGFEGVKYPWFEEILKLVRN